MVMVSAESGFSPPILGRALVGQLVLYYAVKYTARADKLLAGAVLEGCRIVLGPGTLV